MEQNKLTVTVEGKSRLKSKTNVFGGLLIAYGIAILSVPELLPLLNALLPEQYQPFVPIVIGAIVMILREITAEPIAGSVFGTTGPTFEIEAEIEEEVAE